MKAILCPTLLFIKDTEWTNLEKHDLFLSNLVNVIEYIDKHNIQIYWNDVLENLLWIQPKLHPWLGQDTTSSIMALYKHLCRIDDSCGVVKCECNPDIECDVDSKDIISPTLELCHYLIINYSDMNNIAFIVDEKNKKPFVFSCICHLKSFTPQVVYIPESKNEIDISGEIEKKMGFG